MNHQATYSPEDNKLRIYPAHRLDAEDYARVKAAGFRWVPKQELFVAPMWTPEREDICIDLCGEVGDEDKSLVERQEERAERFETYSENRKEDAERAHQGVKAIADNIPLGQPILVGHHSERHARKDAERIQNGMRKAVKMWDQSEYWKRRAQGALRLARYKEQPAVRARRIKGLEADLRKVIKSKEHAEAAHKLWSDPCLNWDRARLLANSCHVYRKYPIAEYPRWKEGASMYEGEISIWSALDGIITAEQARDIVLPLNAGVIERCERWIEHYSNRLEYEHAMLEDSGGTVAQQKGPEVGGGCRCWASHRGGYSWIVKVNKVSVTVYDNWGNTNADGTPTRNFTRTIPFDKLTAVISRAEVEEKRAAGLLVEYADKTGFVLVEKKPEAPKPVQQTDPQAAKFRQLEDTLKAGVKTVVANQLFLTPRELADRMVAEADLMHGSTVLEPSAGTGALLDALGRGRYRCAVDAVEVNQELFKDLAKRAHFGFFEKAAVKVVHMDFLAMEAHHLPRAQYDRVIMNPPFENGADIKHIKHALKFLKPGGRLVAICANGPRQKAQLESIADSWEELPEGTFAGTGVRAVLLTIEGGAACKHENADDYFSTCPDCGKVVSSVS